MRYYFFLHTTNPEERQRKSVDPFSRKPIVRRERIGLSRSERGAVNDLLKLMKATERTVDGREAWYVDLPGDELISIRVHDANGCIEFDNYSLPVAKVIHAVASAGNLSVHPSAEPDIYFVTKCYEGNREDPNAVVLETPELLHRWLLEAEWPWCENAV